MEAIAQCHGNSTPTQVQPVLDYYTADYMSVLASQVHTQADAHACLGIQPFVVASWLHDQCYVNIHLVKAVHIAALHKPAR